MKIGRCLASLLLVAFVSAPVALAQEEDGEAHCPPALATGHIRLTGPTEIKCSGHYVVTREIWSESGPAITILEQDAPEYRSITIDLNELTVGRSDSGGAVIEIRDLATTNLLNLTVRNGRLSGGGIRTTFSVDVPTGRIAIDLERVHVDEGGVYAEPCEYLRIASSRIRGGVRAIGNTIMVEGQVLDSQIDGDVTISGFNGGQIRGNSIRGSLFLPDNEMSGVSNLIEGNTFWGCGVGMRVDTPASVIKDNVLWRGGIRVGGFSYSQETRILNNAVYGGSTGIRVSSERNLIEGNQVTGVAGYGITLDGDDNVYSRNVLIGNSSGAVDDNGTGNLDAGDNIVN
jgi:hypothetical protein